VMAGMSAVVYLLGELTAVTPLRDMPVRDMPVRDMPVRDMPVRDMPVRDMAGHDRGGLRLLTAPGPAC
ncbi:MAG: hypothetical protein KY437_03585, partial [Actinobacteria bacterium]|nr:hypothetical protein [Actinomycetota bacterium]